MYVEDPGAANFVMPLLPELPEAGWQPSLYADGLALSYLAGQGCKAEELGRKISVKALVNRVTPDVVLVGTSENVDSQAFDFISVAAGEETVSIAVVDGPANVESRFRGRGDAPLHHAPDWLFLTDSWTKGQYAAIGFPPERLVVTGHPYYDMVRREGERLRKRPRASYRSEFFPEAPEGQKVVAFLSETSQGLGIDQKRRTPDYSLEGWGASDLRTHIVMEEFLDAVAELDEKPYLVLRLHPKDSPETYRDQLSHFDAVSRSGRPLSQLFAADLVVGLSTSLLVEAEIAGLNTLSILPREVERDLIMTVRDGRTPCATTSDSIRRLLQGQLAKGVTVGSGDKNADGPFAIRCVIDSLNQLH